MALLTTDIEFLESGTLNLGGALQESPVTGVVNDLFDRVTGSETVSGRTEYRCAYIRNSNLLLTLFNAQIWVPAGPAAVGASVEIGIGAAGMNATETAIVDEVSSPVGVTFYAASDVGSALDLGDLTPGDYISVWVKRTIAPGASAISLDGMTMAVRGDAEVDAGGGAG